MSSILVALLGICLVIVLAVATVHYCTTAFAGDNHSLNEASGGFIRPDPILLPVWKKQESWLSSFQSEKSVLQKT